MARTRLTARSSLRPPRGRGRRARPSQKLMRRRAAAEGQRCRELDDFLNPMALQRAMTFHGDVGAPESPRSDSASALTSSYPPWPIASLPIPDDTLLLLPRANSRSSQLICQSLDTASQDSFRASILSLFCRKFRLIEQFKCCLRSLERGIVGRCSCGLLEGSLSAVGISTGPYSQRSYPFVTTLAAHLRSLFGVRRRKYRPMHVFPWDEAMSYMKDSAGGQSCSLEEDPSDELDIHSTLLIPDLVRLVLLEQAVWERNKAAHANEDFLLEELEGAVAAEGGDEAQFRLHRETLEQRRYRLQFDLAAASPMERMATTLLRFRLKEIRGLFQAAADSEDAVQLLFSPSSGLGKASLCWGIARRFFHGTLQVSTSPATRPPLPFLLQLVFDNILGFLEKGEHQRRLLSSLASLNSVWRIAVHAHWPLRVVVGASNLIAVPASVLRFARRVEITSGSGVKLLRRRDLMYVLDRLGRNHVVQVTARLRYTSLRWESFLQSLQASARRRGPFVALLKVEVFCAPFDVRKSTARLQETGAAPLAICTMGRDPRTAFSCSRLMEGWLGLVFIVVVFLLIMLWRRWR